MNIWEILLIAIALSADAFAVAICLGLSMKKVTFKRILIVGLYFGIFQAVMPVFGYLIAIFFADTVEAADHWIAFGLLAFLGIKMILDGIKKGKNSQACAPELNDVSLYPSKMLPYAIATSIDALAVGISIAFLKANVAIAAVIIGIIALILSMIGVSIGNAFGAKFEKKVEIFSGIILLLIGIKILLEHIGVFGF